MVEQVSTVKWLESGGGPLCFVPREVLELRRGAAEPSAASAGSDYDRACGIPDELGVLDLVGGAALVLADEPHATTWMPRDDGGWLVRWVSAPSEARLLSAVSGAAAEPFPGAPHVRFETRATGACHLFDAAEVGDEAAAALRVQLRPGAYVVDTVLVDVDDEIEAVVHRFRTEAGDGA